MQTGFHKDDYKRDRSEVTNFWSQSETAIKM